MPNKAFERKLQELKRLAPREDASFMEDLVRIESRLTGKEPADNAWKKVELARHPERPTTLDYISKIFDNFIELHGDRHAGDDPALVGGIAFLGKQAVTVLGHQKGLNLKDNIKRNYGMAHPEGYRKALRLAKEAEAFGRPVITFIDTPGAYPGLSAEERGIGEAIAKNLMEFSLLETPVVCIIIGEGGSGGALGIGVGDEVYMLENAVYSVISPEGCASILLRDAGKAKAAAELMKMTARNLLEFQVIDGIIPEGLGGAHAEPLETAVNIRKKIIESLDRLNDKSVKKLLQDRSARILRMGPYFEGRKEKIGFFEKLFGKKQ